jgi:hypothetical protein
MGFSPLQNEPRNNYAVVARPQPLLAGARRYFGDCGGNATKGVTRRGGNKNPAARPGFVVLQEKRQIQYFATIGAGAHMSNL